jgi:hypothetical protein
VTDEKTKDHSMLDVSDLKGTEVASVSDLKGTEVASGGKE